MACSNGAMARLAIDMDGTFGTNSIAIPFLYENIQKKGRIIGTRGISGTREQWYQRTRIGHYTIDGRIAFHASPIALDMVLPCILGAAESTNVFNTADALLPFYALIDRVATIYKYGPCTVNRGIFRSQAGPGDSEEEFLECIMEVMATAETDGETWAGDIPAYSTTQASAAPYVLSDAVLTVNSVTYPFHDFVLVIDNHLEPRWVNSLTPTSLCPQDRTILLRVGMPFTAADAAVYANLYGTPTDAVKQGGYAATLVFTNDTKSLTFTFLKLQWQDQSPTVMGKQPIPFYIDFVARGTGAAANNALVVTNVS